LTPATDRPPDEKDAVAIATRALGLAPSSVRRFPTGMQHYVFEARYADRADVVVRIASEASRAKMAGALELSRLLLPLGAPLPKILAEGTAETPSWLILERLPGTDLGDLIATFDEAILDGVAQRVVAVQAVVARTPSAGRYGYAVRPKDAPWATWSDVLDASLARSRQRIGSGGCFDLTPVEQTRQRLEQLRQRIDRQPPIPFLHDTTTKNVIVTEAGEFSGVVDVDDLCFGDPRYAAALTLAVLMVFGGPQSYVAAWLRRASAADDEIFRLYVNLFVLDLMSEQGHVFNGDRLTPTAALRASFMRAYRESFDAIALG
jgi:aminoglycoside phosphotransferase (APT) family kinase protein